jgi:hypothetical protein
LYLVLELVPTQSNLITTTHTFSLVRVDFKTVAYLLFNPLLL